MRLTLTSRRSIRSQNPNSLTQLCQHDNFHFTIHNSQKFLHKSQTITHLGPIMSYETITLVAECWEEARLLEDFEEKVGVIMLKK